ncbi:MAG: S41 family peptidase [Gemmatimonadales bacterium]
MPGILVPLAIVAAGCGGDAAPAAPEPNGHWASEGYGMVLSVQDSTFSAYEVTQAACVPVPTTFARLADEDGHRAYGEAGGEPALLLFPTPSGEGLQIHRPGTASDIVIRRIDSLPARCASPPPSTPTAVLDHFIRTWEEQYILFDQKPVDWAGLTAAARAKITDQATDLELFETLRDLILPFGDAHTGLAAGELGRVSGFRPGADAAIPGGIGAVRTRGRDWFVNEVLPDFFGTANRMAGPLERWCNDQLQAGTIAGTVRYLRILSFSGYADGGYRGERRCLDDALDQVFADTSGWRGLVIDVRVNFGGADPLALGIAERLATAEYVAYSKEARADPADRTRWTPGQASLVRPSARPGYRGPVVELTGPITISAGETFTQALMGRTPAIARVGEHTQGVFSDVLSRRLPNGWQFWLPNEVFRTAEGATFDGPGIPPTDPAPVFAAADRRAGRDPALARALELLASQ